MLHFWQGKKGGYTLPGIAEYDRQQSVLRLLDERTGVTVEELSTLFGVSPVTIRKDLDSLERRRLLIRVRGGAVRYESADEGSFEMRLRHMVCVKQALARAASAYVKDGDVVVLDSSTTCYYLALELRSRRGLVVITNGLRASEVLSDSSSITVILPGGSVRRSSRSLVGAFGNSVSSLGEVKLGFFGLLSLSVEHGLLELSVEEAVAKRELATACKQVYGLFDSTKVSRFALHPFVPSMQVTQLITDSGMPEDVADKWRALGVKVECVSLPPEGSG